MTDGPPNRWDRIDPGTLKHHMDALDISTAELARIAGVANTRTVRKMLSSINDIPHHVGVLLAVFRAHPQALRTARRYTAEKLKKEDQTP